MQVSSVVLFVIGLCFALGTLDSVLGGRMGLGALFTETFRKLGAVALGVMGLFSLAPALAQAAEGALRPLADFLHMDPAAFPPLLFPVDMGGFGLCEALARDKATGLFFGAIAASLFGATVGYCIPVSCQLIDRAMHRELAIGTLSGLVAIPPALFAAGLIAGLSPLPLLWNLVPTIIFSALLCFGLVKAPERMTKIFSGFGRVMGAVGLAGIVLQALRALGVWNPLPQLAPLDEASLIAVRIAIIMTGAMIMVELLSRLLRKPMEAAGRKIGSDGQTIAGMLAAMVAALLIYSTFDRYKGRGRVMLAAFCASGAFVIGGQLGVVSAWAPGMVTAFFAAKLIAAAIAVPLAAALEGRKVG